MFFIKTKSLPAEVLCTFWIIRFPLLTVKPSSAPIFIIWSWKYVINGKTSSVWSDLPTADIWEAADWEVVELISQLIKQKTGQTTQYNRRPFIIADSHCASTRFFQFSDLHWPRSQSKHRLLPLSYPRQDFVQGAARSAGDLKYFHSQIYLETSNGIQLIYWRLYYDN